MIEFGLMELGPSIGDLPGLQSFEEEIQQLQQDGLLDLTVAHDFPSVTGIEATDMGSLLEQFEEASQTLADCDALTPTLGLHNNESEVIDVVTPETTEGINKSDEVEEAPKKDLLKKIKAGSKRKAAILLPMGMPSKRGRGQATSMPANCAPPKLQRIMKHNKTTVQPTVELAVSQTSSGSQPIITVNNEKLKQAVSLLQPGTSGSSQNRLSLLGKYLLQNQSQNSNMISQSVEVVNPAYISADHSYCQTLPQSDKEIVTPKPNEEAMETENESTNKTNVVKLVSCNLEEPEEVEAPAVKKAEDYESSKVGANKPPSNRFLSYQERLKQSKARRQYRKQRGESPETALDEEKYFDKIPAYYTALSIPSKQRKKPKETSTTAVSGAGITREDFFERNPSPPRDPTVFNKLPAYYSCFTNSTKYDSSANQGCEMESDKTISPDNSLDGSRVSSSGYSSRSHSPVMDSKRGSRSRSRSSSCSSSMSRSRSRSHSRSRSLSRGRKRSWRRERKSSLSSHSRSSSRSSYSSKSSRSRSRSLSSDYSSSSSRSHSRSTSRSKSQERRRVEQKERRKEEKCKQMEERRIVYVGRIPEKYTRHDMKKRFGRFGDIDHVQLHFREHGDNYGFVTFAYTCDAYAAVEKGNDIKGEPPFDLCFGGRRQFCETEYEDLDGEIEIMEEFCPLPKKSVDVDFDELLKQAQKKIQAK